MVIWNTLCRKLFDRLRLEDIVCILGYRVKAAYGKSNGLEVSVNPRNPIGEVLVLTRTGARLKSRTSQNETLTLAIAAHRDCFVFAAANHVTLSAHEVAQRFPPVDWAFIRPAMATHLPDDARFDLIGRIQHVGRPERELIAESPSPRYAP